MTPRRFLAWVAVSSKEQAEKVSPELQAQLARQHVNRWGGALVDELHVAQSRDIVLLSDAAASIPAYARLHEHIQRRDIDVLICYDLGRLGRAYPLIMQIVELCSRAGIAVYEIENPPHDLDRPAGYDEMLIRALKSVGYQHEIMKLRDRSTFGRIGRAKAGKLPAAPPYGYRWQFEADGSRVVEVHPEQAPVVRRIAALYLSGSGMISIAAELTRAGVPAPLGGAVWQKNSIAVILRRAWTYAGYGEFYRENSARYIRVRGAWDPLWDDATAESIEQERAARAVNRRIADTPSRLTGIVICAECGRVMWEIRNDDGSIRETYIDIRRRTPRRRRARFYCHPAHPGGSVGTRRVLAALEVAIDVLCSADLSAIPDDDMGHAAQLEQQIAEHAAAIQRHQAALRRADTAFVSGAMDDDRYQEQVRRLRAAIEAEESAQTQLQTTIDADRQRGNRRERLQAIAASGRAMLTTDDTAAANIWFRRYVRVFVRDNQVVEVRWL